MNFSALYQYGYLNPAGGAVREKGGREHGHNTNSEWRRFRIAAQAKVLNRFTLVTNWNIGGLEGRDEFRNGKRNQTNASSLLDELYMGGMKLMLGAEHQNSHGTDVSGNKGFTGWGFTGAMRVNF